MDKSPRGRGTDLNPQNRFQELSLGPSEEEENPKQPTVFFRDQSRSLISKNASPDLGFGASINPYRGCEHGCIYCYARPTHEYLSLSAGIDFESKIFIKEKAPELLKKELSARSWKPQLVMMSGNTDCYQPVERKLGLTRRCLEVFAEFRNPVSVITKNHLVLRDLDVLQRLAEFNCVSVCLSLTTLNPELCGSMEPRTSRPQARLEAVRKLASAGIPVGVNVAPVIPGLTDEEIPALLKAAREAGACFAGMTVVRLPYAVKDLFEEWVKRTHPERAQKILNRIRELRGGKLNDPQFGSRMRGEGNFAQQIDQLFRISRKKLGFGSYPQLTTAHFRKQNEQLNLI